jgi:hypothetical protein
MVSIVDKWQENNIIDEQNKVPFDSWERKTSNERYWLSYLLCSFSIEQVHIPNLTFQFVVFFNLWGVCSLYNSLQLGQQE